MLNCLYRKVYYYNFRKLILTPKLNFHVKKILVVNHGEVNAIFTETLKGISERNLAARLSSKLRIWGWKISSSFDKNCCIKI